MEEIQISMREIQGKSKMVLILLKHDNSLIMSFTWTWQFASTFLLSLDSFLLSLLLVCFLFRLQTSSDHGANSNNKHFAKGNRKAAIIACKNLGKYFPLEKKKEVS